MRRIAWCGGMAFAAGMVLAGCSAAPDAGLDPNVTSKGSIEVTARLVDIPGEFIDRKDYDYAFVMEYEVLETHRGEVSGKTIYVGHYNPLKARESVADARVEDIGGNVRRFRVGAVHRIALEVPIDDHYMGGIVNRYFEQDTGPIYWALWTNRVVL